MERHQESALELVGRDKATSFLTDTVKEGSVSQPFKTAVNSSIHFENERRAGSQHSAGQKVPRTGFSVAVPETGSKPNNYQKCRAGNDETADHHGNSLCKLA
ncbi:UNVERIFIED_CONTAM: hypothetical protein K2H54_011956 [Gekko kuhli]